MDTSSSDCTDVEKRKIISKATALLAFEAIPAGFFTKKKVGEVKVWKKEFHEVFEVISIGGGFYIAGELSSELNNPQVVCR